VGGARRCALAVGAIAALLSGFGAPGALARGAAFGRPVRLAASALESSSPVAAFAPGAVPAVAFSFFDPDRPARAQAWLALLRGDGRAAGARALHGAAAVLDAASYGGALQLLVAGPAGRCCTAVSLHPAARRGLGRGPVLVRDRAGGYIGSLVAAGRGLLAVVADTAGVWAAQARSGTRFGPAHRLTGRAASPETALAAPLAGGRTLVAWAGADASYGTGPVDTIDLAAGTATRPPIPVASHTLASGHVVDELALTPGPPLPALAWIEGFYDSAGAFRTELVAADYAPRLRPRVLAGGGTSPGGGGASPGGGGASPGGGAAPLSGLAGAGDGTGDELLAYKSCDAAPICRLFVIARRAGGGYGTPVGLGTIDAGTTPALVVAAGGAAVVGWIDHGQVRLMRRSGPRGSFGHGQTRHVRGALASGLTLAAGPGGRVLAAWLERGAGTAVYASLLVP